MGATKQEGGGGRLTAQRRAIFDAIRHSRRHPTADEIYREVNRQWPVTSRATVYNTLNRLKRLGVVRELHEGTVTRFDGNVERHHHFVCGACGGIEDLAWDSLPRLEVPWLENVRIESYSVTLRGVCKACGRAPEGEKEPYDRQSTDEPDAE